MHRQFTALLLTFSLFLMLALQASAQTPTCMPEQDLREALARHFDEHPLSTALTAEGLVLQIYVGASGSWTMATTRPGGPSCIVAAGHDFSLLHRDGLVPSRPT